MVMWVALVVVELLVVDDGFCQGWKKLRSLRSRILDNSYLVRQIRLDPGEAPVVVRQIWPGQRPGFSSVIFVCLVKTKMDNKHQTSLAGSATLEDTS